MRSIPTLLTATFAISLIAMSAPANAKQGGMRAALELRTSRLASKCQSLMGFQNDHPNWFVETDLAIQSGRISPEQAMGCAWPIVFKEFNETEQALAPAARAANVALSLAAGLYEAAFDFEDSQKQSKSWDALITEWLFAVRSLRQTWPFAKQLMNVHEPLTEALAQASFISSDPWQTTWNAYLSLVCTKTLPNSKRCQKSKSKLLATLVEALRRVQTDADLQQIALSQDPSLATDILLTGHEITVHRQLETLIGSFTGSGSQHYFISRGDGSAYGAPEKLVELKNWFQRDRLHLTVSSSSPIPFQNSPCANLKTGWLGLLASETPDWLRSSQGVKFDCVDETTGARITRPELLERLDAKGLLTRTSLLHVRRNLLDVMAPSVITPEKLKRMLLLHSIRSLQEISSTVSSTALKPAVEHALKNERAIEPLVNTLIQALRTAYSSATENKN